MTIWLHSTVLATTLVATVAIGVAGASFYVNSDMTDAIAKKGDRLALATSVCNVADASGRIACGGPGVYVTVESRPEGQNLSILTRVPAN